LRERDDRNAKSTEIPSERNARNICVQRIAAQESSGSGSQIKK
jgi:hypothetical protein